MGKVAKLCDMLCVSYGKTADVCFSGGSDGNVFIWHGVSLQKVAKAHEGPVFAMHSLDKVSQCQIVSEWRNPRILLFVARQNKYPDLHPLPPN